MSKHYGLWVEREIGLWLRETRVRAGYTQKEIGDLLGITYQQVQKYESATNRLSVAKLLDFCKVLGVLPHSLFLKLRYKHLAGKHEYAGQHATWITQHIKDDDVLSYWLQLGESLATPNRR